MSGRLRTSFFSGEQGGHRQRRRADDDDQDDESGEQQLVCGAPGARLVRNDALSLADRLLCICPDKFLHYRL